MPRRSSSRSSGSFGGLGRPRPPASAPLKNPPKPAPAPPAPAPVQGGSAMGGIGATVVEGMAFGGGSAIAHRAVDAVMGPRVVSHTVVSPAPATAPATTDNAGVSNICGVQSKAFQDCLTHYGSDISKCQFYMDMLSECRKNSASSGLTA